MNAASQAAIAQLGTVLATRLTGASTVADITALMTNCASVAQTLGTDSTLPSVVNDDANALNTAAGEVAALIGLGDTAPSILSSSTYTAVPAAAGTLFTSAMAALVAADVATNGCSGYSSKNVSIFQGAAGLSTATLGQYDAITVAKIRALLSPSTPVPTIPAACATGSGSGGTPTSGGASTTTSSGSTATTTTTTTPAPAAPMPTAAVVGITVASVAAVGTLGYLLMKTSAASVAKTAKMKNNPQRRRRA
jgi:hypothetical protein